MAKRKEIRFKVIPTSHLVLEKGGKILLLRRFNTGYEDGNYSVVAGHLDGNETVTRAEERMDFFVKAKAWKGEPRIMESDKCDDLSWFDVDKLTRNMVSYVLQAIRYIRDKKFYSEFGW